MKKSIWILTHYAAPPQYETRIRNNAMAKYLMRAGYDVTIFSASTIHNTDINLIEDNSLFVEKNYGELHYIHVNAPEYRGNGFKRKFNMFVYPKNLYKTVKRLKKKPDVIINDLSVMAFNTPFRIGKYTGAPLITEVRDLWPESIISYGYLKRDSLLARFLYAVERKMYIKSDRIVYTMEGWSDYIQDRGWQSKIDIKKTIHINNGLDLESFTENKSQHSYHDADLSNEEFFNVVYTGSIRRVNNLGKLLDIAKLVKVPKIRFLIWGDGDELEFLKSRVSEEGISNVFLKGHVEKKYIPSIVSQADLNFAHNTASEMFKYGISFNKIFDYFAAGRPIVCDFACKYNPVIQFEAGVSVESGEVAEIANRLDGLSQLSLSDYNKYCTNALKASTEYDFLKLTEKMITVIESL